MSVWSILFIVLLVITVSFPTFPMILFRGIKLAWAYAMVLSKTEKDDPFVIEKQKQIPVWVQFLGERLIPIAIISTFLYHLTIHIRIAYLQVKKRMLIILMAFHYLVTK